MFFLPIMQVVAVALWVGAAIKLFQLQRAPEELPLRALTGALVSLAVAWTSEMDRFLDQVFGGLAKLAVNLGGMGMAFCVSLFFVYSVHGAGSARARRLTTAQVVPLAFAVMTMLTAWAFAPASERVDLLAADSTAHVQAAVFAVAVVAYLGYALGVALFWCQRYARRAQRVTLRRGLRLLVVALACFEVVCAVALLKRVAVLFGPDSPVLQLIRVVNSVGLIVGAVAFILALTYPTVTGARAAAPVWRRHWRDYRALRPLWQEMAHAFPDLALGRTRCDPRPWGVHRRRYRRAIEIRDGLVQLGPYYPRSDIEGADMAEHAERVVRALRAKAAGADQAEPPHPIPMIGGPGLDSDVEWLVRLSRAVELSRGRADWRVRRTNRTP